MIAKRSRAVASAIERRWRASAAAIALLGVLACRGPAPETWTISGVVTYRERVALPPQARLRVWLGHPEEAGAPARGVAASQRIIDHQVPLPFAIVFDAGDVDVERPLALEAEIVHEGERLFATDRPVLVGRDLNRPFELVLRSAR